MSQYVTYQHLPATHLSFLRSRSGCRDLAIIVLKSAATPGAPVDDIGTKIQSACQADSWEFYHAFLPELVDVLIEEELVDRVIQTGTPILRTTSWGRDLIACPDEFWSKCWSKLQDSYRTQQLVNLKANRAQG